MFHFSIWVETTNLFASWFYRLLLNWLIHSYQVGGGLPPKGGFQHRPKRTTWSLSLKQTSQQHPYWKKQMPVSKLLRSLWTGVQQQVHQQQVQQQQQQQQQYIAILRWWMVTWPFWRLSVSQLICLCFGGFGECSKNQVMEITSDVTLDVTP